MVSILVLTAIVGILVLQDTLAQVVRVNEGGLATVEQGYDFLGSFRDVRRNLHETALGRHDQFDQMSASMATASGLLHKIEQSPLVQSPKFGVTFDHIHARFPHVQALIAALVANHQDVSPARVEAMIGQMNEIDVDVNQLCNLVREQAQIRFDELDKTLRWQTLAIIIVSILVVNLSILAFLRMGAMILRPVDKLVTAARELGKENFNVRVQVDSEDEFGQLAHAYNHMAEQLEASERRRMEVLSQVALAMNHELKNLINIIELQLTLVSKRAEDRGALESHLKQIRESLGRITKAVDDLRHARRIVLTDYTAGLKMLDLHRSAQLVDAPEAENLVGSAAGPHL
jgi:methyl-accepting chemotaxis protein